jgi:hypothetical protein
LNFFVLVAVYYQRIDMSEYMERHSVSRLIGAPPGYVGYEGQNFFYTLLPHDLTCRSTALECKPYTWQCEVCGVKVGKSC